MKIFLILLITLISNSILAEFKLKIDHHGNVVNPISLNKTQIDKVYVTGNHIKETFKGLKPDKKARVLSDKLDIFDLINKDLDNNDYLMIKGSNSTGLHNITNKLKKRIIEYTSVIHYAKNDKLIQTLKDIL